MPTERSRMTVCQAGQNEQRGIEAPTPLDIEWASDSVARRPPLKLGANRIGTEKS